jgi:hypothetical protein
MIWSMIPGSIQSTYHVSRLWKCEDIAVLTGGPGLPERSISILRSLPDELWARPAGKDNHMWCEREVLQRLLWEMCFLCCSS